MQLAFPCPFIGKAQIVNAYDLFKKIVQTLHFAWIIDFFGCPTKVVQRDLFFAVGFPTHSSPERDVFVARFQVMQLYFYKHSWEPIFAFVFDGVLFVFAYTKPAFAPLFALPLNKTPRHLTTQLFSFQNSLKMLSGNDFRLRGGFDWVKAKPRTDIRMRRRRRSSRIRKRSEEHTSELQSQR